MEGGGERRKRGWEEEEEVLVDKVRKWLESGTTVESAKVSKTFNKRFPSCKW